MGNLNRNAFEASLKNFHCFWAFKRRNVNELLPGLHIWWKQLQHSLYTFCILSVVCVYQWLPVCFEQTKPFLEIVHNSRKCIFSITKKLEMHIQIQRNLSMIIYQALMVIRIEFHIFIATCRLRLQRIFLLCLSVVSIASFKIFIFDPCDVSISNRGYIQRLIRFCKRRRIYLPIILHYSNLYFYIFVLSPISSADFYDFSKGKFP